MYRQAPNSDSARPVDEKQNLGCVIQFFQRGLRRTQRGKNTKRQQWIGTAATSTFRLKLSDHVAFTIYYGF